MSERSYERVLADIIDFCVDEDVTTMPSDYWQKHLDLARRARIGELVEQLTDACRVVPMVGKGEDLLTELRARVEELTDEGESSADTIERHNTLARRAEIGALVERLVDGLGYLQMECEADANGEVGMYDVRSHDASSYTDTLLDALRALAKEVSGDA